jgi:hypothetical protein
MSQNTKNPVSELPATASPCGRVVASLTKANEQLAAAKKNSSTSSKPPSSDIVKPKPAHQF